jgi:hypothetical protein
MKNFFIDPYFEIFHFENENTGWESSLNSINENKLFFDIFKFIKNKNSNRFTLIIKDTSFFLQNYTSFELKELFLKTFLSHTSDLYFLSNCQDKCEFFKDVPENENIKITQSPTLTQGIIYHPNSIDKILHLETKYKNSSFSHMLNSEIKNKNISSTVFIPNLIVFNYKFATKKEDFEFLNQCSQIQEKNIENDFFYVWICLISILYFIVFIQVIRIGFLNKI